MQTGRAEGGPGPEARRTQPVRFSDGRLTPIWDKVRAGARLTAAEGLILLETEDLLGVGRMADHAKRRREADRTLSQPPRDSDQPLRALVHVLRLRAQEGRSRRLRAL